MRILRVIKYIIDNKYDNYKINDYLRKVCGYSSRIITKLKQHETGIVLNGCRARTVDIIKSSDVLEIGMLELPKEYIISKVNVDVLYDDEDIIIYNKPANMPCHQSRWHQQDTLANVYAAYCTEHNTATTFRPVNRLDMDTSGAVVIAKNPYCASLLNGKIDKTYIAVCCGIINNKNGIIEANIARKSDDEITRIVDESGQYAKTEYSVIAYYNNYTVIKAKIYTGRTHQIRVHMSYIGYPLAGDLLYGGDDRLIGRQALHCESIMLEHPVTKVNKIITAPLPNDMKFIYECIKNE